MSNMSFTLDTSHFEMSPLNNNAFENIRSMEVTRDTSHAPIGPYGPVEQSPSDENARHSFTAFLRPSFDCGRVTGRNAVVERKGGRDVCVYELVRFRKTKMKTTRGGWRLE